MSHRSMRIGIILTIALILTGMAVVSVSADVKDIIKMPLDYKFGTYTQKPWAGTTINVAMVSEPRNVAISKLAPEFEKLTGIKVVFNILAYPTLQEKQMVALTQGSGAYDIVDVDCVWIGQYAGQGWTIPVEELILRTDHNALALDDFIPAVLSEQGMWQDRIYGLPCIQAVFGMSYRTDILAKYNVKVPETWDDLREAVKTLNLKEPGVYGTTFMGRRGVQLQCTYDNILWSYGGEWFDKNFHATINSKAAVDALDYFKSLIPYAPPGVLSYDWDENTNAFAQGKAAITVDWNNPVPTFYNPEKSKIVGKFKFTLVPGVKQPDGSIKRTPTFGGWSLEIPNDSQHKEAAWEFMVWASSQKLDPRLAYSQNGSRASGLLNPTLQKKYIEYAGTLASLPIAKGRPRIPAYSELADALEVALSEAMSGAKSSKDALDDANAKFEQILARMTE